MCVKLFSKFFCHELLLLDAGLLTGEVAEVEDACPADFTDLIELDAVDGRRLIREDSFDTHATGNFADFGVLSKFVMMFDMLAGRLEIIPLLVLFHPGAWRR